jgi:hypothetical protein
MEKQTKTHLKGTLVLRPFVDRSFGSPGHLTFEMLNTVSGITVAQKMGRPGSHPSISPSEVSRQWQAKIPQGEKYEEV